MLHCQLCVTTVYNMICILVSVHTRVDTVLYVWPLFITWFVFQFLPIPELIPFRLTRQIRNLMMPLQEKGLMESTMIHSLRALREDYDLLLSTMDIFIKEPSLDWLVCLASFRIFLALLFSIRINWCKSEIVNSGKTLDFECFVNLLVWNNYTIWKESWLVCFPVKCMHCVVSLKSKILITVRHIKFNIGPFRRKKILIYFFVSKTVDRTQIVHK
jgi:hypothetical protein